MNTKRALASLATCAHVHHQHSPDEVLDGSKRTAQETSP